jgi:hypothetical protein
MPKTPHILLGSNCPEASERESWGEPLPRFCHAGYSNERDHFDHCGRFTPAQSHGNRGAPALGPTFGIDAVTALALRQQFAAEVVNGAPKSS